MADDSFDVLVVGGGVAGSVAAYILAKAGLQTVVIERGNYAGSKNMTGGRLYAHSLQKIMPGFAAKAPVERRVVKERVSFVAGADNVTLEYHNGGSDDPECASYTVLRGVFDQWLMARAEEAGAQFLPGVRVDEIITRDGKAVGVRAGDDTLEASVIILADGVNSLLGEKLGMVKPRTPGQTAVGVKELVELPEGIIQDRFNLEGNEGLAWLFAGAPTAGHMGGGFLYTNRSSLSLGVVCGLNGVENALTSLPQMLEDFRSHPAIRPLIRDGKRIEYSAHVIPEGGIHICPEIVGNGILIVGDAAGFCLNLGYTVRGMDLAVASAQAAAETVVQAMETGDFSRRALGVYREKLEKSVLRDMRLYRKLPAFLEHSPRLFRQYPEMLAAIMRDIFHIDGAGACPLWKKLRRRCGEAGFLNLASDMIRGGCAL